MRDILSRNPTAIVSRVLKSVEATYWQREIARREKDSRFDWADKRLAGKLPSFDKDLRGAMLISTGELSQIIERALDLQTEATLSPAKCMESNLYSRDEAPPITSVLSIATRLGIEERYLRALGAMAQGDRKGTLRQRAFESIIRDVDTKEYNGRKDLAALASLSSLLKLYGLRDEDEAGIAPVDLANAVMVLRGTSQGQEAVEKLTQGKARVSMEELESLFADEGESIEGLAHGGHHAEEVGRFLEDLGIDAEHIDQATPGTARTSSATVRIALTDEEKLAYVTKAVGRHVHLVDQIMRDVEGALTWEEVDRAIKDKLPDQHDEMRDRRREFRSRIRG